MPMKPNPGESEKDFVSRCIGFHTKNNDKGRNVDQISAMCYSMFKESDQIKEAEWDAAFINSLPDSCFGYIEPGGSKDGEGKTVPRSLRHFPYKDASGKIDLPHLTNALGRAPQSPFGDKAMPKLKAAAKSAGVGQAAESFKQNIHEAIPLSEGQIIPDQDGKKSFLAWWPLLREGPGNKAHKNFYHKTALESVVSRIPLRNKMFFGHMEGDVKPTERSVKDWAASIRETKIENGVLFGKVQALDPWLKERMYDAPADLAASIEARGKAGKTIDHEGEKWNLIEEIRWLNGFQIVDYPGNAPMGITITESDKDSNGDEYMTIAELKEKNPELYSEIEKELKEAAKADLDKVTTEKDAALKVKDDEIKKLKESQTADQASMTSLKESVIKLEAKVDGFEALGKKKERDAKVTAEMAKLPKEAITDKFKELVESAKDEKSALELIDERAKLFEGKVIGHGKTQEKTGEEGVKERYAIFAHALGQKTPEEIEAERKAKEGK
jgi:hypothetical protein